jgi:hypothetical protein
LLCVPPILSICLCLLSSFRVCRIAAEGDRFLFEFSRARWKLFPLFCILKQWCGGRSECARAICRFGLVSYPLDRSITSACRLLHRTLITEEELLECLCGFVSDALQPEDVFDDLEQLEKAEPEGKGQFDVLHGGEQSLVGCGDEVEDGVVESRCLDLSADVMFMFLAHANNFFYVFFVISDEERQSVLQP